METLKFKTNINCSGCVANVTPALNSLRGIKKWQVDTASTDKILTVRANEELTPNMVISALGTKGFSAEEI